MSDLTSPSETRPRWMSLDIENQWVFAGITHGLQIWDASNPSVPVSRGVVGPASFLSWRTDPHEGNPVRDVDAPPGNDNIVAVAVVGGGGLNVFNSSVKNSPSARYADAGKAAYQVYAGRIAGRDYGFVAASDTGALAYDLTTAASLSIACVDDSPTSTSCGPYRGRFGHKTAYKYVDGVGDASGNSHWVAVSGGRVSSGIEIWNVSSPASPQPVVQAFTGFTDFVHAPAMWRSGSSYYLAFRIETSNNTTQLRIYNVTSCLSSGCSSLGNPIATRNFNNPLGEYYLTYSQSAGRNFLYHGHLDRCNLGLMQNEWLYDVTNPSNPVDITPAPAIVGGVLTGYWGWYYRGNPTGFNEVMPRVGKFLGQHFYRAAYSVLDIHELTSGGNPTASFTYAPSTVYRGQQIDFSDTSLGSPNSWSWSFQDATPSSSSQQDPQNVVFNSVGNKTVSLLVENNFGEDDVSQTITVLDPAPAVASVSVSPNPALVCQPITFTANSVTGSPAPSLSWSVKDSDSLEVATGGNVNPFVWNTVSALAGTYTATVTATNTAGVATRTSPVLTLNALPTLPTSFTPTADPFTGGTVQFHLVALGATEWNWDFGDGAGYTGWVNNPVNGPNPIHSYQTIGTKNVKVKIRNCIQGERESATLTIIILEITQVEASFSADCPFGFCAFTTGQAVSFTDASDGDPDTWEYAWNNTATSTTGCNFSQSSPTAVTSHTYTTAGTYRPCLRVKRGAQVSDVFVHAAPIVISTGGGGGGGGNPSVTIGGPASGQPNQALSFNATANNCPTAPTSWTWDPGSGGTINGTSNAAAVSITFTTTGSKTIRATAVGGSCSGTSGTKTISINGNNPNGGTLNPLYTFTPASPAVGQTVSFDASSSGGSPTGFNWSFGDNSTGSGATATHAFAAAGSYQVKLDISRHANAGENCPFSTCNATLTKTIVVAGDPPPSASFTTTATCNAFTCSATTGQQVSFTSTSQNVVSHDWTFGDTGTASGVNATHTWAAAGNYQVVLVVRNAQGTAVQTSKLFTVTAPPTQDRTVVLPWIADTTGAIEQLSDVYVMNPTEQPMTVDITFYKRGTPEPNPPRVTRTIPAHGTFYAPDALNELFDRNDTGGFLVMLAHNVAEVPAVVSLNRTLQGDGTTYGQLVPGLALETLVELGGSGAGTQYLLGLFDTSEKLTQIGVTNPHAQQAKYRLRFIDHLGNVIAASNQDQVVAPFGQKQYQVQELRDLYELAGREDYRVEVVQSSGGVLFAYAGVVRTGTDDPSFVEVSPPNLRRTYLLGATSTPGFNNALFVTDVVLSNPTTRIMQIEMTFRALGVNTPEVGPVDLTLLPNETQRIEDVLFDQFDLHDSVGVLTFESEGADGLFPMIHGEVYQDSGPENRYGLFMPARRAAEVANAGQRAVLTGLRQKQGDSNTTVLLFNPSAGPATCDLIYYDLAGHEVGRIDNYSVSPGGARQINPSRHPLPAAGLEGGFSLVIEVESGGIMAGAQVVINQTNDPAYIAGEVR